MGSWFFYILAWVCVNDINVTVVFSYLLFGICYFFLGVFVFGSLVFDLHFPGEDCANKLQEKKEAMSEINRQRMANNIDTLIT